MHADDALAAEQQPTNSRRSEPRRKAAEFLANFLRDGSRPADEVFTEADEKGIAEKTLNRAAKELGCINIESRLCRRLVVVTAAAR